MRKKLKLKPKLKVKAKTKPRAKPKPARKPPVDWQQKFIGLALKNEDLEQLFVDTRGERDALVTKHSALQKQCEQQRVTASNLRGRVVQMVQRDFSQQIRAALAPVLARIARGELTDFDYKTKPSLVDVCHSLSTSQPNWDDIWADETDEES